jgi:hypothetical protein
MKINNYKEKQADVWIRILEKNKRARHAEISHRQERKRTHANKRGRQAKALVGPQKIEAG